MDLRLDCACDHTLWPQGHQMVTHAPPVMLDAVGRVSWADHGRHGPHIIQDLLQDWVCPPHAPGLHCSIPLLPALQDPPSRPRWQRVVQGRAQGLNRHCKTSQACTKWCRTNALHSTACGATMACGLISIAWSLHLLHHFCTQCRISAPLHAF